MQQQGMFGPTPEELQFALSQQQNDADQQRAMQWGRQNFDQQVSSAAYGGAQMVGRGIEGALRGGGILPEDPRLAEAKKMMGIKKSIMESGIDPADLNAFYPEMIKQLYQGGMVDKALEVEKQYQTIVGNQEATKTRRLVAEAKAQEDKFKLQQLLRETEQDAEKRRVLEGKAQLVMKNMPNITMEEAVGLASDSNAFAKLINPKIETELIKDDGVNKLINKQTGEVIKVLGKAGKTVEEIAGSSAAITSAAIAAAAKKTSEAFGTAQGKGAGEAVANIQAGHDALTSVRDAVGMLDKGIYAGGYGPLQEGTAKYTMGAVGSKERVANTEEFRSHIGNTVVPRLKEFGGNDSNEEMKYLEKIMAGDTTLEPRAIRRILKSTEAKIKAGIERVQKQQQAASTGKPLPTGPSVAPRRYNQETGEFE
jgi:hypothetical protein